MNWGDVANCKTSAPAGQASRGPLTGSRSAASTQHRCCRLCSSPHVGLPNMSVSFEVRKQTRNHRLPLPVQPAGSKVSHSATQGPNVLGMRNSLHAETRLSFRLDKPTGEAVFGGDRVNWKTWAPAGRVSRGALRAPASAVGRRLWLGGKRLHQQAAGSGGTKSITRHRRKAYFNPLRISNASTVGSLPRKAL